MWMNTCWHPKPCASYRLDVAVEELRRILQYIANPTIFHFFSPLGFGSGARKFSITVNFLFGEILLCKENNTRLESIDISLRPKVFHMYKGNKGS